MLVNSTVHVIGIPIHEGDFDRNLTDRVKGWTNSRPENPLR